MYIINFEVTDNLSCMSFFFQKKKEEDKEKKKKLTQSWNKPAHLGPFVLALWVFLPPILSIDLFIFIILSFNF
jgi:hypothetical protein